MSVVPSESWLLVTPARNEAHHLPALRDSLVFQHFSNIALWIIVDDGSSDGTDTIIDPESVPFPIHVLRRQPSSGLAGGGAFRAFLAGAECGLERVPDVDRIMKLDADVILTSGYFRRMAAFDSSAGLVGGVVATGGRDIEQKDHVPGFVKGYSRAAFELISTLPCSIGLDVIDETTLREAGLSVIVDPGAHVLLQRTIGDSEGVLRGRWRNGRVSRWSGYDPLYFGIRLLRYAARRPVGIGAVVMAWAYLTAGAGPFPARSRKRMRHEQRQKLLSLLHSPRRRAKELYGVSVPCDDERCCAELVAA